jgi:DNA primase
LRKALPPNNSYKNKGVNTMPHGYSREIIDSLKQQAGIRPYACLKGLQRHGVEYRALCPFHDDKRAGSFTIYTGKSHYFVFTCHSCGKSGDAVDIVMKVKNLPFLEAVKMIAKDTTDFNDLYRAIGTTWVLPIRSRPS